MSKKKVLVADDNRDAADSLVVLLDWSGYEAVACYDGAQAVAMTRTVRPDLVILDINMPIMDGYAAARTIRSAEGQRVLLVALTGCPDRETSARAAEVGFDAHFAKPMNAQALEGLLHRLDGNDDAGGSNQH